MITLDYIDDIKISKEDPPMINLHALDYLKDGLIHIAKEVETIESKILFPTGFGMGLIFGPSIQENRILPSYFHWFGISVVNYTRIIGLLDIMESNGWKSDDLVTNRKVIKEHCKNYVSKVIPEIYVWRNKIAAHAAATDPFNSDNLGTIEASLMNPVSFSKGHIYVSQWKWSTKNQQSEIPEWSITKSFQNLVPRYWPYINEQK